MLRTLSLTAMLVLALPAFAQNPQVTPGQKPVAPVSPPNTTTTPPEKVAPPDNSLSKQLSRKHGTIRPPNVDPGMTVAPPRTRAPTMPVIPPPGTPGGNRSVVPK